MLPLAGRRQVHSFDADDTLHRVARLGAELNTPANDHARVHAADKAKFDHTVLGERFDDHADLVHVGAQHQRPGRLRVPPPAEHHEVPHRVGLDAVGIGHGRLQDILAHLILQPDGPNLAHSVRVSVKSSLYSPLHHRRTSPSN